MLALVALKLALLSGVELGKDEAGYWYWATHHLDASYAFILFASIRLAETVLPGSDLLLRLPIVLGSVASAALLWAACSRFDLTHRDRWLAVLCFCLSHWAWHTGSFLHPDGVLVPVWLATLAAAHRADRQMSAGLNPDGAWLGVGALAGATALCKYSGAVLAAGLVLALLVRGGAYRRAAVAVTIAGLAVSSPLLWALWQLKFELPFTLGSLSQVATQQSLPVRAALFLLAPLVYVSPPLLWRLYGAIVSAVRQRPAATCRLEDGLDLAVVPALVLLATFGFFALTNGQIKGNWILPGLAGLWPLAFRGLGASPRAGLWSASLLVLGVGQAAVPALTVRVPALAQQLVALAPSAADGTYTATVSATDLPREPTFSWTERVCEYHGWEELGERLAERFDASGQPLRQVSSAEYGVAFGLSRYLPSRPVATVRGDPRFAHIAPAPGGATLVVSRALAGAGSGPDPNARPLGRFERRAPGCSPVEYEAWLAGDPNQPNSQSNSPEISTESR